MSDIERTLSIFKYSKIVLKTLSICVALSVAASSPSFAVFGLECRKSKSAAGDFQMQLQTLNTELQKYKTELNQRVRFFTKEEKLSRLKQCIKESQKKSSGLKLTRQQCDQMWNPKYEDRFPQCFDAECERFSTLVLTTSQRIEVLRQRYDYIVMGNDKCFDPKTVAEVRIRNGVKP